MNTEITLRVRQGQGGSAEFVWADSEDYMQSPVFSDELEARKFIVNNGFTKREKLT